MFTFTQQSIALGGMARRYLGWAACLDSMGALMGTSQR
jgi:hypothetical protein